MFIALTSAFELFSLISFAFPLKLLSFKLLLLILLFELLLALLIKSEMIFSTVKRNAINWNVLEDPSETPKRRISKCIIIKDDNQVLYSSTYGSWTIIQYLNLDLHSLTSRGTISWVAPCSWLGLAFYHSQYSEHQSTRRFRDVHYLVEKIFAEMDKNSTAYWRYLERLFLKVYLGSPELLYKDCLEIAFSFFFCFDFLFLTTPNLFWRKRKMTFNFLSHNIDL